MQREGGCLSDWVERGGEEGSYNDLNKESVGYQICL